METTPNQELGHEFESLIKDIQRATGLNIQEISEAAGYARQYLYQVRAKRSYNDALIQRLNHVFEKDINKNFIPAEAYKVLIENAIKTRASIDVYGPLIIEVLAHLRSQPSTALAEEVRILLDRRLQKLRDELKQS